MKSRAEMFLGCARALVGFYMVLARARILQYLYDRKVNFVFCRVRGTVCSVWKVRILTVVYLRGTYWLFLRREFLFKVKSEQEKSCGFLLKSILK